MANTLSSIPVEPMNTQIPVVNDNGNSVYDVWYTNRPLNARTQTNRRYLDTAVVAWHANVVWVAVWADPFTVAIPFDEDDIYQAKEVDGNYPREIDSEWFLVIPTDGTYLLTWLSQFASALTDIVWIFTRLYYEGSLAPWGWILYQSGKYRLLTSDVISFNVSGSFKKWDRVKYYSWHSIEWESVLIIDFLTVTKLS